MLQTTVYASGILSRKWFRSNLETLSNCANSVNDPTGTMNVGSLIMLILNCLPVIEMDRWIRNGFHVFKQRIKIICGAIRVPHVLLSLYYNSQFNKTQHGEGGFWFAWKPIAFFLYGIVCLDNRFDYIWTFYLSFRNTSRLFRLNNRALSDVPTLQRVSDNIVFRS